MAPRAKLKLLRMVALSTGLSRGASAAPLGRKTDPSQALPLLPGPRFSYCNNSKAAYFQNKDSSLLPRTFLGPCHVSGPGPLRQAGSAESDSGFGPCVKTLLMYGCVARGPFLPKPCTHAHITAARSHSGNSTAQDPRPHITPTVSLMTLPHQRQKQTTPQYSPQV